MGSAQIQGFTTANLAEVEANTRALRTTLRPEDYGSLGIYSNGAASGLIAAGAAANAPFFSARWTHATNLAVVKRLVISMGATGAFTAGVAIFQLFVARSFSVSDSGGTSILPPGNQAKLRTSGMGTTLWGDMRIALNGALTPGTRALDSNPLGSLVCGAPATAGQQILPPFAIFDVRPGEHPLVLAQNEGLVLQITVPAVGTWNFGAKLDWSELTTY